jgi:hypothetical protein
MLLLVRKVVAKGSRIGFNVPSRLARSGVSTTADAASQPAKATLSAFWLAFLVDASRKNNPKPHQLTLDRHAHHTPDSLTHPSRIPRG